MSKQNDRGDAGTSAAFSGGEAEKRLASYPSFPTGSAEIDRLMGGGYKAGRVVMAFGRSNTGKSQLAMQAVLCAAHAGTKSLYIDTEGAFRPERVQEMARERGWDAPGLLEQIVYLRCNSAAEQGETIRRMAKRDATSPCRLVAIDTLTRNFSLDLPGSANMPGRQGALDAHLSAIARDAFLNGRAYLLTNRVTFSGPDTDEGIGGRTVTQLVHTSIHMQREEGMVRLRDEANRADALVRISGAGIGV